MLNKQPRRPSTWPIVVPAVLSLLTALTARSEAQMPHDVLYESQSAFAVQTPKIEVARSDAELAQMFAELGNPGGAPVVDFNKHTVIAYFMGWRPSSGYNVFVKGLSVRRGELRVDVLETSPGRRCGGLAVLISPAVAIVTIPWRQAVVPEVRKEALDCGP